ncbi:MAG: flippase-like domain-containing protein [bacterium]|nr:flippase-like domain-containing protein [bacterium]
MNKKMTISFIVGLVISAAALYFAFRKVPLGDLVSYLASINYLWLLPALVMVMISFYLRAVRWQIILTSSRKITIWRAYHPMMIGFMINCVLPGRLGEVARPVILQKKEKIPFTTGLATVAAERIFDICLLIFLFIITVNAVQVSPDVNVAFGKYQLNRETLDFIFGSMLKLGVVLIAGIILVSIGKIREFFYGIIRCLPSLFFFAGPKFKMTFQQKLCEPIIRIIENIAQGFTMIRYPRKIILCSVLSLLIWALLAFSYYLFSLGSPGVNLTFYELSVVMVIICFFISLPSVPGWWGLWEAAGVFGMSLFGVSAKEAAGFTLANHALQVFPVIIMGIASAMILSVNIRKLSFEGRDHRNRQPVENPN